MYGGYNAGSADGTGSSSGVGETPVQGGTVSNGGVATSSTTTQKTPAQLEQERLERERLRRLTSGLNSGTTATGGIPFSTNPMQDTIITMTGTQAKPPTTPPAPTAGDWIAHPIPSLIDTLTQNNGYTGTMTGGNGNSGSGTTAGNQPASTATTTGYTSSGGNATTTGATTVSTTSTDGKTKNPEGTKPKPPIEVTVTPKTPIDQGTTILTDAQKQALAEEARQRLYNEASQEARSAGNEASALAQAQGLNPAQASVVGSQKVQSAFQEAIKTGKQQMIESEKAKQEQAIESAKMAMTMAIAKMQDATTREQGQREYANAQAQLTNAQNNSWLNFWGGILGAIF